MPTVKPASQHPPESKAAALRPVQKSAKSGKDSRKREIMKSMRIDSYTCDIIERAASITGDSFTHFVVQAALAKAQNALIDEAFFPISDETYEQLRGMLENPPELSGRMKDELRKRRLARTAQAGQAA